MRDYYSPWISHVWKVGGCTPSQLELVGNIAGDEVKAHILAAEARNHSSWLKPLEPHNGVALICAGGPSLRDEIPSIQAHKALGAKVFGCNGSPNALWQNSIETDFHVIVDARPENLRFTEALSPDAICLYASQCHPSLHDRMKDRLVIWHPAIEGIMDLVGNDKERAFIGGGTTSGMKAATLAWALGYRTIHLFGFDSCYRDGNHHAYPQSLNDGEQVIDVEFDGKAYKCAPWMIQQAEDFEAFAPQLMDHGVTLHIHGSGLIPDIAKQFSKGIFKPEAADFRAQGILERLEGVKDPQVAEIGVFAGDLSRRLLARRQDLKLLMIDSWASSHEAEYTASDDFHTSLSQEAQDKYCELTRKVTSFAGDRARIIRANSEDAAKQIEDNFLDLVFIDADHSYEGCKRDIEAYWGKVKPGGIISGHDYANDAWKFGPMVKKAVDEFIASKSLVLELGPNYTWYATKPLTQQGNSHE